MAGPLSCHATAAGSSVLPGGTGWRVRRDSLLLVQKLECQGLRGGGAHPLHPGHRGLWSLEIQRPEWPASRGNQAPLTVFHWKCKKQTNKHKENQQAWLFHPLLISQVGSAWLFLSCMKIWFDAIYIHVWWPFQTSHIFICKGCRAGTGFPPNSYIPSVSQRAWHWDMSEWVPLCWK